MHGYIRTAKKQTGGQTESNMHPFHSITHPQRCGGGGGGRLADDGSGGSYGEGDGGSSGGGGS